MTMGRPLKEINWEQVDKLCAIQCTGVEIANFLEVSVDTLTRRCKELHGVTFAEYFEQKRGSGRISLRRKQFEVAQGGNVTMLIWLGKQYLDQSDKVETRELGERPFREMSDAELMAKIKGNA